MLVFLIITIWVICAAISAGLFLAYLEAKWPELARKEYKGDLRFSWAVSLLGGPIGLCIVIIESEFCKHGFMNPFVLDKYNSTE